MKKTVTLRAIRALFLMIILHVSFLSPAQELMRANLRIVPNNGAAVLMDGNMTNYDNIYSNDLDMYDAWKMTNFGENFGIYRNAQNIVVERRKQVMTSDTTFFRMWNMQQRVYQLQLILKNPGHPGLVAFLKDKYLKTTVMLGLNDTTLVNFTISADVASADPLRFQLIYISTLSALPVRFAGYHINKQNDKLKMDWQVTEETLVEHYEIENSMDGINFNSLNVSVAKDISKGQSYTIEVPARDCLPFFRIKAVSIGNRNIYSQVIRLEKPLPGDQVTLFSNPVTGHMINIEAGDQVQGAATITLISNTGSVFNLQAVNFIPGKKIYEITVPQGITSGLYRLRILLPGKKVSLPVLIL